MQINFSNNNFGRVERSFFMPMKEKTRDFPRSCRKNYFYWVQYQCRYKVFCNIIFSWNFTFQISLYFSSLMISVWPNFQFLHLTRNISHLLDHDKLNSIWCKKREIPCKVTWHSSHTFNTFQPRKYSTKHAAVFCCWKY